MTNWTISSILARTQDFFAQKGISSARLDAEVLLAYVLQKNRIFLYTHYDQPLTSAEQDAFREVVRRRGKREPVAYIVGEREFFGRAFAVSKAVLIPRPETEHIIEEALRFIQEQALSAPRILDVGTGSGAIAITMAAEVPEAYVKALDISVEALLIAQDNARKHAMDRIHFVQSDLLAELEPQEKFDLILSNPPYVETTVRSALQADVRDYEPATALFAGGDGLDVIRKLIPQVLDCLVHGGFFACEIGSTQQDAVEDLLRASGAWEQVTTVRDLASLPRLVIARVK